MEVFRRDGYVPAGDDAVLAVVRRNRLVGCEGGGGGNLEAVGIRVFERAQHGYFRHDPAQIDSHTRHKAIHFSVVGYARTIEQLRKDGVNFAFLLVRELQRVDTILLYHVQLFFPFQSQSVDTSSQSVSSSTNWLTHLSIPYM